MGTRRYNPSLRAPLPVATAPRDRLLSHLRRAREEAVAMARDGVDIGTALQEIKEAIREVRATGEFQCRS